MEKQETRKNETMRKKWGKWEKWKNEKVIKGKK